MRVVAVRLLTSVKTEVGVRAVVVGDVGIPEVVAGLRALIVVVRRLASGSWGTM